jgi:hypothetical protein
MTTIGVTTAITRLKFRPEWYQPVSFKLKYGTYEYQVKDNDAGADGQIE